MDYCLPSTVHSQYTLQLLDSYGDGWTASTWIEIVGEYGNVFFKTMELDEYQETYTLSLYYAIKKNQEWKMTVQPHGAWNEVVYDDDLWNTVTLGGIIGNVNGTQYYRKSFTGLSNMAAYELSMNYMCGIVVYINGIEVYRDNIQEGNTASGCYSSLAYRGIIRPGAETSNTVSLIAIELHFLESSPMNPVDFDAFLAMYSPTLINTDCYIANDGIMIETDKGSNANNLFDWSYISYLNLLSFATTAPIHIDFSFTKSIPYINGLRVWPYTSITYAPDDLVLNGKNSNNTYSEIMHYQQLSYVSKQDIVVKGYLSANLFRNYRLAIYSTVSASSLRVYELHPLICSQGYPSSIEFDSTLYTKLAGFESVIIRPIIHEFTGCSISPSLPQGIELDESTCVISGVSSLPIALTTYTVTSVVNGKSFSGIFSMEYVNCNGQVIDFYRTYKANAESESFEVIEDATQQVVFADVTHESQSDVHHYVCLPGTEYTITLSSTTTYWSQFSWLYVRGMFELENSISHHETLLRAHFDAELGLPSSYTFSAQYQIPHNQNWFYKMGEVPENWYKKESGISGWTEKPVSGYPDSTNQIQLYKKTFTVNSIEGAALVLSIRYLYGCVVYLNNHEVFRNGVTGTLSSTSFSTNAFTDTRYHQISLPLITVPIEGSPSIEYVITGQNTIAIGLISNTASQTSSVFDCVLRIIRQSSQSRFLEDYELSKESVSGTNINNFPFYYRGNSFYSSTCDDNSITIQLSHDRREWISSIIIQLHITQVSQQVRQFILKARNPEDGDNWTLLKNVTRMTWSQMGQQRKIFITNNRPFNEFRFENFGTDDPDNCYWKFSRIDFMCDGNQSVPDLSYEHSSFSVFKDIEMAEEYTVGEYYLDFTVSPSLPQGILIDPNSGTISGTVVAEVPTQTYTITAKKFTGEPTSTTVTIAVSICTGGKSLITLVVLTDTLPAQSSYVLYEGKDTSGRVVDRIDGFPIASALNYADFCLDHGIYTLELRDSMKNGWSNPAGYYLTVDVGTLKFETGQVPSRSYAPVLVTTQFSSYLPFQIDYDDWKVFKGSVSSNWNTMDYDDSQWETVKAKNINQSESVTVYIRRSVPLTTVSDYHVLNVHIKYAGGVVAYFNGVKVARFNIMEDVNHETESETLHDVSHFSKFHIILNMVGVSIMNVIAFEVHRPAGQSSAVPVVFDATGVFGVSDCSIVVDSFTSITGSDPSGTTLDSLFDLSSGSFGSLPNTVGSFMEWTVENLEGSRFNSYAWQTVFARTKWGFSLYSRMASDEDYLAALEVVQQSSLARERVDWSVPLGIVGYKQFRYEVDVTPSSSMTFSSHFFQYCKPSDEGICPGIGLYPPVGEGHISPGPCDYGFIGYSYRNCSNGVLSEIQRDQCVYRLPANLHYSNTRYTFVVGIFSETGIPSFDYVITHFRLHENDVLPPGLALDSETGNISGAPTQVSDIKSITVYGENPKGPVSVVITLNTRLGECNADGNFPKTHVGEIAVYECSAEGSYIGTQRRECVMGKKDGEWRKIQGTCFSITLILIIAVFAILFIVVVLFFIIRSTRKAKAIGGVRGKKKQAIAKKPVRV